MRGDAHDGVSGMAPCCLCCHVSNRNPRPFAQALWTSGTYDNLARLAKEVWYQA